MCVHVCACAVWVGGEKNVSFIMVKVCCSSTTCQALRPTAHSRTGVLCTTRRGTLRGVGHLECGPTDAVLDTRSAIPPQGAGVQHTANKHVWSGPEKLALASTLLSAEPLQARQLWQGHRHRDNSGTVGQSGWPHLWLWLLWLTVSKVLPGTWQLALSSPDVEPSPSWSTSPQEDTPLHAPTLWSVGLTIRLLHAASPKEPDGLANRAPSCQQEARRGGGGSVGQVGPQAMARPPPLPWDSSLPRAGDCENPHLAFRRNPSGVTNSPSSPSTPTHRLQNILGPRSRFLHRPQHGAQRKG